ncbi:hypothetical protein HZA55_07870 [Candidatus Poribacteria bacterium]|nr:hypothetical protein [Candidatus Poribacteria bacterium]
MDIQEIKNRLLKNLEIKIISVILAIFLWFYAIGQQKAEIIFNIPLELEHKENMIIYDQNTEFVTLTLRSQQNIIRGLSKSQFRAILHIKEDQPGAIRYELANENISGPSEIEIIDISPKKFTSKIGYMHYKTIPIKAITEGSLPDNFFIQSIITEPSTIKIESVKSKIEKINYIETAPINLNGVKVSFSNILRLNRLDDGIIIKGPQEIKVTVKIAKEHTISNIPIKVINHSPWKAETNPVTIQQVVVYGDIYGLENLIQKKIEASIIVRDKKKGEYFTKDIELTLPDDIKLKKIIPDKIKIILKD